MALEPSPQSQVQHALALHRQGKLAEAEALYGAALRRAPGAFEPHYFLALLHYQRGAAGTAHPLIQRAVALKPRSAEAQALLAGILLALDRPGDALAACDRLLALKPRDVEAACNRAVILTQLGRLEEAISQYGKVLAIAPNVAAARFNRGTLLARCARFAEALVDFERLLAVAPQHLDAHRNRATVLVKLGRLVEALASYDHVLAERPGDVETLNHRGSTLKLLNRESEALATYERALAIEPRHADTLFNYANLLFRLGRLEPALAAYDRVLAAAQRRDEDQVDAMVARADILMQLGRLEEARQSYEQALGLAGDRIEALFGWGNVLAMLGRVADAHAAYERMSRASADDPARLAKSAQMLARIKLFEPAARDFRRLTALAPDDAVGWAGLANCLIETCDWGELESVRTRVISVAASGHRVDPFLLVQLSDDPALHLEAARRWAPIVDPAAPPGATPRTGRADRIRVVYLSPDFRDHPVAYLAAELFERHDRSRFDVVAVSYGPDDRSEIRSRIVAAFERFHDARGLPDEDIADLLHKLDPDIVVDLCGHTEYARPAILARRPAPIQVSYLGYCGTSGSRCLDYIIADPIVAPFADQAFFDERIVQLPDSFMVYDSTQSITPPGQSRSDHSLPETGFVFCCFNQAYKLSAPVFETWMRVMRAVDGSVLWLRVTNETARANLRRAAEARGVAAERLVFAPGVRQRADHLARHRFADLFLDTIPYNAHATACDALFAGLPVLTCRGRAFAARVGTSLLHAVDLPELVTTSMAEYEALALELASDPARLRSIRGRLAENRARARLFDADRFRRHLEAAYRTMVETRTSGEAARSFAVEPIAGPAE